MEIKDPLAEVQGKNRDTGTKDKNQGTRGKKKTPSSLNSQQENMSKAELEAAMNEAAARLDFEEAAMLRDLLLMAKR